MYPPPYNGAYATPWLWVDGRQRGYNYNLWRSYVVAQIGVPTPVQITLSGEYDPATRSGTIKAVLQNDSTEDITARVSVVITEDSCYYLGPNGDPWHNHVCRDYIPDQSGTVLTVSAGGTDSVIQPFTIASTWVEERCNIVVYAQSTTMVPADSSYPAFQGAQIRVLEMVGVKEGKTTNRPRTVLSVIPNPCRGRADFRFSASSGIPYRLSIYSPAGSLIEEFSGLASGDNNIRLNRVLRSGVYLYCLQCGESRVSGKLVVKE